MSQMGYATAILSGKWKAPILWQLHQAERPLRYAEIKRAFPRLSARMLTRQLREMEAAQLISRNVRQLAPRRVEYELTDSGVALRPLLEAMHAWAGRARPRRFGAAD